VEKIWVSKDDMQSTSSGGARKGILKNSRRLSLEESILANHVSKIVPPITRARGVTMSFIPYQYSSELLFYSTRYFLKEGHNCYY